MQNLWTSEDQSLLEILKEDIVAGDTSARPYPHQELYITLDCFKDVMGEVILQADNSVEARKSEAQEKSGGKYEFDTSLEGISLRNISCILISTVSPLENSRHSFVLEAAAVSWSVGKFRKYLWVADFTVLSNCSGLQKIF